MARQRIKPPSAETPPAEEAPAPAQAGPQSPDLAETAQPPTAGRRRIGGAQGAPPPATSAEAVAEKPGAQAAATALAAALDEQPEIPKLPFSTYPHPSEELGRLIEMTIDQGEGIDLVKEFEALEAELEIKDALTPQVVRAHLNRVEANASRAHRLFVLTKAQFATYEIHAQTALGAMRDVARHKLELLKNSKQMSKQVTERDVDDVAATTYPDEWANINDRLKRGKLTLDRLERFADLWQRRSYSLSSLNQ